MTPVEGLRKLAPRPISGSIVIRAFGRHEEVSG